MERLQGQPTDAVVMTVQHKDFEPVGLWRRAGWGLAQGLGALWSLRAAWLGHGAWVWCEAALALVLAGLLGSGLWRVRSKRGRIQCLLTEAGLCGPWYNGLWWRYPWHRIERVAWEQDQDGRRGLVLHLPGIQRHRIEILRPALQAALIAELKRRIPAERWSGGAGDALDSETMLKMA